MKFRMFGRLAAFAGAALLSANAMAITGVSSFTYNLDAFDSGSSADIVGAENSTIFAHSFVGFQDNDASGGVSTGDTFRDVGLVRITEVLDSGSNVIDPIDYGSGPGTTHEITVAFDFSGVQIGDNEYLVTSINRLDFFYDDSGNGFTNSDFSDNNSFTDGVRVLTAGDLLAGGGTNSGPVLPDGTITLIYEVIDDPDGLSAEDFLTDFVIPNGTLALNVVTGDNDLDDIDVAALEAEFGIDTGVNTNNPAGLYTGGDFDFGFATSTNGTIGVAVIPEPMTATLGLFGLGALALRRRRNA